MALLLLLLFEETSYLMCGVMIGNDVMSGPARLGSAIAAKCSRFFGNDTYYEYIDSLSSIMARSIILIVQNFLLITNVLLRYQLTLIPDVILEQHSLAFDSSLQAASRAMITHASCRQPQSF